jgi:hypothetical protein
LTKERQHSGRVLRPPADSGLDVKWLDGNAAGLFDVLRQPGMVPDDVVAMLGDTCDHVVGALVLDGLLEIEDRGSYWCGADAHSILLGHPPPYSIAGRIATLSVEALQYAEALQITDPAALADRLYRFGSLPVSPRWLRRFAGGQANLELLTAGHLGSSTSFIDVLRQSGRVTTSAGWIKWYTSGHAEKPVAGQSVYKLYVSPTVESLGECLGALVQSLTPDGPFALKAPNAVRSLLRPDKLIVYFTRFDQLLLVVDRLVAELDGLPVHGVPFTADVGGNGLMSWAIDPPRSHMSLGRPSDEPSWRTWVTNRLACALLVARHAISSNMEPWRFALERLRFDGVDPESWTSAPMQWPSATGL